jgi:hypothetical protein
VEVDEEEVARVAVQIVRFDALIDIKRTLPASP